MIRKSLSARGMYSRSLSSAVQEFLEIPSTGGDSHSKSVRGVFSDLYCPQVVTGDAFSFQEGRSFMTFEGEQHFGRTKIMEKFQALTFQKICHVITATDCQPMFDGGIMIVVLGQLKTDDDPPHSFYQVFVLKPIGDSFYLEHDIFRLALHHSA
ncbi:probable nuclear transport factor 2 isoform X1 [Galendromus occidentalis]|uniref:Probable nuclear transport factor 2 isoform X1 n=1 Tax=Galendromus occidentalis TaxID=34638 RepID=A0AAJ7L6W7_9ACAR|nr:probable nuclear transport factor 2 isoform X1 [Galendromus occidentalis]